MRILLIAYDNGAFIHFFPQGLAYIAAVLLQQGHDVEIYSQDMYHFPESHLTTFLDRKKFDVVGVSVVGGYYQYRKLVKISDAVNRSRNRPIYMIGGHGPSPEPEYFMRKTEADIIVRGEGEATIGEIMTAMENHKPFDDIKGIAFRNGGKSVVTSDRPPIANIDTIPMPAFDLFPMDYYTLYRMPQAKKTDRVMRVLTSRGCPFKCNFCYRMDKGIRLHSPDQIVNEMTLLKEKYGVSLISFTDELLMCSVERIYELCESFIQSGLGMRWICNGRLNYAKPEALRLMKRAGCVFINYGIEAFDDEVLKNMNKGLTTSQIVKGVENTIDAGISPGLNIIWGNIGDNRETLRKGVEFLLKYDDCTQLRTIRPVTPYPGSALYYFAIEQGLLTDCEDFYEHKHKNSDLLTINFTDLSDEDFHSCLLDANKRLLTNYYNKRLKRSVREAVDLYSGFNPNFRGFRQI